LPFHTFQSLETNTDSNIYKLKVRFRGRIEKGIVMVEWNSGFRSLSLERDDSDFA
jgi:hypothetical protein